MSYVWEQRKFKEGIQKYQNTIYLEDDVAYNQVSIRNNGTVEYRDTKLGINIGRKRQYLIDTNSHPTTLTFTRQTIYEGGIGFVPKSLNGCIVTENMPLLDVDTDVFDPEFMKQLFKTFSYYILVIEKNKPTGSAQKAMHENTWLECSLLYPNIQEQREIGKFFIHLDNLITLHQRKILLYKYFLTIDWEQRKLGDVANIVGGGTPNTNKVDYWDGDIDWYTPAEIGDVIYIDSSKRKITENGLNNSSAKILPVGSVLFTSRAGIGKMAILRKKACTNQGFQSIIPHSNELDSYFIFSRSEELKRYGEVVGAGSTFVEVSGKQMSLMDLMIPSMIDEQIKIGDYFRKLDQLITLHQRKCIISRKNMVNAWEQRKLSEIATMHARIGWQNLRTSEFLENGDYMLITGTDFVDGSINYSTCYFVNKERYEQDKNIQIKNGSILITKDGTLGKVALVQGLSMPATLNAGIFNIEIKNELEIDNKYLFQYLKAPFLLDYVKKRATGGTIKHLNQNILVNFPVLTPQKLEQTKIGQYFSNLDNLITLHQWECIVCTKIKVNTSIQCKFIKIGVKLQKCILLSIILLFKRRKISCIFCVNILLRFIKVIELEIELIFGIIDGTIIVIFYLKIRCLYLNIFCTFIFKFNK